jgi:hypothetical protein
MRCVPDRRTPFADQCREPGEVSWHTHSNANSALEGIAAIVRYVTRQRGGQNVVLLVLKGNARGGDELYSGARFQWYRNSAIGRVVLTNREHIIALEPFDNWLVGTLLRYPDEVRSADEYSMRSRTSKSPRTCSISPNIS